MINANILLESFGNSLTKNNSNSSRFIKTIQVRYGERCKFSLNIIYDIVMLNIARLELRLEEIF